MLIDSADAAGGGMAGQGAGRLAGPSFARKEAVAPGWPLSGGGAAANDIQRTPFYGSTDVDFTTVGAPVFTPKTSGDWPSPGSEDPIYPGVLVLAGQHPVDSGGASATILIATLQNRRDGRWALDGAGIGLSLRGGMGTLLQDRGANGV